MKVSISAQNVSVSIAGADGVQIMDYKTENYSLDFNISGLIKEAGVLAQLVRSITCEIQKQARAEYAEREAEIEAAEELARAKRAGFKAA